MSYLSVVEFQQVGRDYNSSPLPAGKLPGLATQNVSFTGTANESAAFNAETNFIRVVSDVDARVSVGEDPSATQDDVLIAAGQAEYFGVTPGHKISAIEVV
jgi:hypothetical protein